MIERHYGRAHLFNPPRHLCALLMLGALIALFTALSWALAGMLYRKAIVDVEDPLATNWFRAPLALIFTFMLSLYTGEARELPLVFQGGFGLAWIMLATTLAIVLGDTFYLIGLRDAGLSIGYPVSYVYPLYASLLAVALLGERITLGLAMGLTLALTGVWAASFNPPRSLGDRGRVVRGVLAAIATGICWGLGAIVYKVAVYTVKPINVNLVKLAYLIAIAAPFAWRARFKIARKSLLSAFLGGLMGLGVGDWLFYTGLSLIGVVKMVTLTTASPLISIFLAKLFLHEGAGIRQGLGALLIAAGVAIAVWL